MTTQLDMAEQQLYGWHCAKAGEQLIAMVESMGLTEKEWLKMCQAGVLSYLTASEFAEIDEYLLAK